MKIDWKYIALFISLALCLSYPVQRGYLDGIYASLNHGTFLSESTYLLAGISTLIAALVTMIFHKTMSNKITIFGKEIVKNVLILMLPMISFSIIGLNNDSGMHKSLYGFSFAFVNTIYAFTEEFGWRRYLQNALEGLNRNFKYLLIGVIWWIWHFRFDTKFDLYIFPLICIGGGYLLGKLADDTRSILPVISMHTLIILTTNSGKFGKNEILGIGIVVLGWIIIEQIWRSKAEQ